MSNVMRRNVILAGAALFLGMPVVASAATTGGMIGDCVDCHTMHNSFQGQPVAVVGLRSNAPQAAPIQNLLRMDCVACHAGDPTGARIYDIGDSHVPQVLHGDTADLAGGNFEYITSGGNRKGHNVVDLFPGGDTSNTGEYAAPPGKYHASTHGPADVFGNGDTFDKFTCAGSGGCHGTRNQLLNATLNANNTVDTNVGNTDGSDGKDYLEPGAAHRTGISAISGAHHNNHDGQKDPAQNIKGVHDGAVTAAGYRFINGLKGYGNETDRWMNTDETSHNEYYGSTNAAVGSSCGICHINATNTVVGETSHVGDDSTLVVPNQSMSGFCTTCHGEFHSVGAPTLEDNGSSGAFLRHPSDYLIPSTGEYAGYTVWNKTAPVARPVVPNATDGVVHPGTDMVMCLSCHMAHASQYDSMLRFDYTLQTAGAAGAADGTGCLACHTTKGVLKP